MNSFIALSGIGSAAIDSCLDSKLLQPLFIDSTKTQFVHPSHNSPTTDAPLNQFIDLVVDQIENWTFWNKGKFILNSSSQEVNAYPLFSSWLGASNLIDYKLGQLHPLPPIPLHCVRFHHFCGNELLCGKMFTFRSCDQVFEQCSASTYHGISKKAMHYSSLFVHPRKLSVTYGVNMLVTVALLDKGGAI